MANHETPARDALGEAAEVLDANADDYGACVDCCERDPEARAYYQRRHDAVTLAALCVAEARARRECERADAEWEPDDWGTELPPFVQQANEAYSAAVRAVDAAVSARCAAMLEGA